MHTYRHIISLGPDCATAWQINRHFACQIPTAGFPTQVFDWQITPTPALLTYLRRRFGDVFERVGLEARGGWVHHTVLGTIHPHQFPTGATDLDIDENFADAAGRLAHLVSRWWQSINAPGRKLFVRGGPARPVEAWGIRAALHAMGVRDFDVLCVGAQLPQMPNIQSRPYCAPGSANRWQGCDEEWDRALDDIRLDEAFWPVADGVRLSA